MMQANTIIFDLDGTLVDTAPDLTLALNHVLAHEGRPPVHGTQVRGLVGRGARVLIEEAMAMTGEAVSRDRLGALLDLFVEYYGHNIARESVVFPGVRQTLQSFSRDGLLMGVATNKYEGLSRQLLEALDLQQHFPVVVGGDTLNVRKPDPEHLLEVVRRLGGDPRRALMVGDSTADIDAAKAAGMRSVAVSFGYPNAPVSEMGADAIIDSFRDLEDVASELL